MGCGSSRDFNDCSSSSPPTTARRGDRHSHQVERSTMFEQHQSASPGSPIVVRVQPLSSTSPHHDVPSHPAPFDADVAPISRSGDVAPQQDSRSSNLPSPSSPQSPLVPCCPTVRRRIASRASVVSSPTDNKEEGQQHPAVAARPMKPKKVFRSILDDDGIERKDLKQASSQHATDSGDRDLTSVQRMVHSLNTPVGSETSSPLMPRSSGSNPPSQHHSELPPLTTPIVPPAAVADPVRGKKTKMTAATCKVRRRSSRSDGSPMTSSSAGSGTFFSTSSGSPVVVALPPNPPPPLTKKRSVSFDRARPVDNSSFSSTTTQGGLTGSKPTGANSVDDVPPPPPQVLANSTSSLISMTTTTNTNDGHHLVASPVDGLRKVNRTNNGCLENPLDPYFQRGPAMHQQTSSACFSGSGVTLQQDGTMTPSKVSVALDSSDGDFLCSGSPTLFAAPPSSYALPPHVSGRTVHQMLPATSPLRSHPTSPLGADGAGLKSCVMPSSSIVASSPFETQTDSAGCNQRAFLSGANQGPQHHELLPPPSLHRRRGDDGGVIGVASTATKHIPEPSTSPFNYVSSPSDPSSQPSPNNHHQTTEQHQHPHHNLHCSAESSTASILLSAEDDATIEQLVNQVRENGLRAGIISDGDPSSPNPHKTSTNTTSLSPTIQPTTTSSPIASTTSVGSATGGVSKPHGHHHRRRHRHRQSLHGSASGSPSAGNSVVTLSSTTNANNNTTMTLLTADQQPLTFVVPGLFGGSGVDIAYTESLTSSGY